MEENNRYNSYSRYNINNSTNSDRAAAYSRNSPDKYSHKHIKRRNRGKKRKNTIRSIIALLFLGAIGVAVYVFFPINVTVNGKQVTLTYDKTVAAAVESAQVNVKPGNFVAVDFSVITPGEGAKYYAEVDGTEVFAESKLRAGNELTYTDGKDIMEEYTSDDSKIQAKSEIVGVGAIHKFEGNGEPGIWSKMRGKISGKYAERQTKDPSNVTCKRYNVDPGKDKVIALTFDDGPSSDYTQKVLDLLKKYDAHATFFVIGENLEEKWGQNLIAKEEAAGHQVCTHTYDHARPVGGLDITYMSAEKQVEEVTKGKAMIAKGIKGEVSSVVRLPGGNLNELTCRILAPYISAEIGWNIDTGDWEKPGKDVVLKHLELASSGDIILCHDGGGDRSQTVAALEDFLKEFSSKGYSFITIDEMMKYEPAKSKNTAY